MLNNKEKQIIMNLRKNSRANLNQIAKETGYANSTTYDLLHKLEEKKILEHKSIVTFEKVGYPLKVFVIVKTTNYEKDKLQSYLQAQKRINSLQLINSKSCFHIEGIFKNQREVEEFLEELEEKHTLSELNVYNVLETLQHEKFLTEVEHFE